MNCPVCRTQLSALTYEGVNIHTCNSCGGEFIGGSEMSHIVRTRDERFPAELRAELASQTPTAGISAGEDKRDLDCPACSGTMQLINFAMDTGVHVDRCADCNGLWLDQEELERIQVLVEQWADNAPQKIQSIARDLETARRDAAESTAGSFNGSRFSFVNALINRILDAA